MSLSKSDSKGWWIGYSDGTYLKDAWYQSPSSGLWYYMGADGYMLTNTKTPDGYFVNADGVYIAEQEAAQNTAANESAAVEQKKERTTSMESSGHIYHLGRNSDYVVDISEKLDEMDWVMLDNTVSCWLEDPRAGEDYLDMMLYDRYLSDASANKVKHQLMTTHPHTNTVPYDQLWD